MSNKNKNQTPDISYFRLSLTAFLKDYYPELLKNDSFIKSCADSATEIYEQAIKYGYNAYEASEQANAVLFDHFHFSKYDTILTILWNEFENEVVAETAGTLAYKLLAKCEKVFENYKLSELSSYDPEYDLLYTELTGTIENQLKIMNYEL